MTKTHNHFLLGSRLFLNIADANGNSGGVPPLVYTVAPGDSTACLRTSSTPSIQVDFDSANTLATCDTVPLHITGGTKPYTVTIAITDAFAPINATMGPQDDLYEWVNVAAPNSQLVMAISDR